MKERSGRLAGNKDFMSINKLVELLPSLSVCWGSYIYTQNCWVLLVIVQSRLLFTSSLVPFQSFPCGHFLPTCWARVQERVRKMFALHVIPDMVLGVVPEHRADAAHVP